MYNTIILRVMDLIRSPRATWVRIREENRRNREIQNKFFYPLVAMVTLGTIAGAFLGSGEFEFPEMLKRSIVVLTSNFAGYFLSVILLNEIVSSSLFNMEKQYSACVRMVAYSSSILLCINTIVAIVPDLFILRIGYFYTAFVIWTGSDVLFNGLEENQKGVFTVICFILLYLSPFLIEKLMYMMMK